ncbi:MAG: hypothetical protein J4F36_12080 [Nitrosopumilaceae archaeon]|nr:hypothetical protein [Nitrosopumilaceae archaeon]
MELGLKLEIIQLFFDNSNRPKKTPRHESSIQIMLEKKFSSSQVKNGLSELEVHGILNSIKYNIKGVGDAKFYLSGKLPIEYVEKIIPGKIEKSAYWIARYSDVKTIKMLGEHLHYLVKNELRANGFKVLQEKQVNSYKGREWSRSKHTLDIIAEHQTKQIVVGVEIKNMLTQTPKSEVVTKLEMCKVLGIYPIFASRWQEIHRQIIENEGGLLWQFKEQIYPFGQEVLVSELQKRFGFPVIVKGELPEEAKNSLKKWINRF